MTGNTLRTLKDLIPMLRASGHCTEDEARGFVLGIDTIADGLDRTQAQRDQEDEQHLLDSAALRAFEALLPLRAPLMDPASGGDWKEQLAVEVADVATALALELKRRRPQRETLPPAKPPSDVELQELFGPNALGAT